MTSPPQLLTERFNDLLSRREHPKTLCPSEVARSFSRSELSTFDVSSWRDLMPRLREMAFEARDRGDVEILQKGEIVSRDRSIDDVKGPIRLRLARTHEGDRSEYSDD